jgi:hypothetical protein
LDVILPYGIRLGAADHLATPGTDAFLGPLLRGNIRPAL